MSVSCKNWTPGVPPAGINGSDLDAATVTNAKLAGSITSDKLSKPYAIAFLNFEQATPAARTGIIAMTMPYAGVVVGACGTYGTAPSSGTSAIDVHVGATYASHHSVFGTGSKLAPGLTSLKSVTATTSGALGVFSAGQYLRVDIDSVGSGTKANLQGQVIIKQFLQS